MVQRGRGWGAVCDWNGLELLMGVYGEREVLLLDWGLRDEMLMVRSKWIDRG